MIIHTTYNKKWKMFYPPTVFGRMNPDTCQIYLTVAMLYQLLETNDTFYMDRLNAPA